MPSASLLCACEEYLMVWASLEQRDDWLARAQEEVGREPRWPQRGRITSKVRRVWSMATIQRKMGYWCHWPTTLRTGR